MSLEFRILQKCAHAHTHTHTHTHRSLHLFDNSSCTHNYKLWLEIIHSWHAQWHAFTHIRFQNCKQVTNNNSWKFASSQWSHFTIITNTKCENRTYIWNKSIYNYQIHMQQVLALSSYTPYSTLCSSAWIKNLGENFAVS